MRSDSSVCPICTDDCTWCAHWKVVRLECLEACPVSVLDALMVVRGACDQGPKRLRYPAKVLQALMTLPGACTSG